MELAVISFVVFTVVSQLTGTADGAFTQWTEPPINTLNGNGTAATKIAEDKPVGATGVTLATDATTPTFTILSQPTTGKLALAAPTGVLNLTTGFSFNFEKEPIYVIVVKCVSNDNITGTATVTLSITDVNEAPAFSQSQYSVTIPDGSGAGTKLMSALATDEDVGQTVTHSLDPLDADWAIDAANGSITVASGKKMNQTIKSDYKLVVKAIDNGSPPKTGSTTVSVTVTTYSKASAVVVGTMTMILIVASMIV